MSITTTLLLLAALPVAAADTPYTATGWVIGVPVPGIWCTNALGQVGFRGNTHLARVVSTDERLTGRRTIFVDGAAQADGSSIIYGPVYHEVGTWDAAGTNFTPTGGMWEISYRGTMGSDGSLQLHLVGTGWGGTIDGLRLDETLTRIAGPTLDPTIPYQYTGTIKLPPVNTIEVVDDFDDDLFTGGTSGKGTVIETNGQFIARGDFPVPTRSIMNSFFFGWPNRTWSVADGMTLESRADLVRLDENGTNLAILAVGHAQTTYGFHKGRDFAYVWKWSPVYGTSVFSCERAAVMNTNVVLALALTPLPPNVVITARVLDKTDTNTVLYQLRVVDTPDGDPSLTMDQFQALTGMQWLDLVPDQMGEPFMPPYWVALGVFQNTDGNQPVPTATFDNLELRTSEIPGVGIERAVRLRWPASATINYAIEGAPTLQGPWMPVQDTAVPGMNQMTVPANDIMGFFRLRQAP
jgi:hypothetical protein